MIIILSIGFIFSFNHMGNHTEKVAFFEVVKDAKSYVWACKEGQLKEKQKHLPPFDTTKIIELSEQVAKELFVLERDNTTEFQQRVRAYLKNGSI